MISELRFLSIADGEVEPFIARLAIANICASVAAPYKLGKNSAAVVATALKMYSSGVALAFGVMAQLGSNVFRLKQLENHWNSQMAQQPLPIKSEKGEKSATAEKTIKDNTKDGKPTKDDKKDGEHKGRSKGVQNKAKKVVHTATAPDTFACMRIIYLCIHDRKR